MNFDVLVTFDLEKSSSEKYERAYEILGQLGLLRSSRSTQAFSSNLTTLCVGKHEGGNADEVGQVVLRAIADRFAVAGIDAELLVMVGESICIAGTKARRLEVPTLDLTPVVRKGLSKPGM